MNIKNYKIDEGIGYPIRMDLLKDVQDSNIAALSRFIRSIAQVVDDDHYVLISGSITQQGYDLIISDAWLAWQDRLYYLPSQTIFGAFGPYSGFYMEPSKYYDRQLMWKDSVERPTIYYDTGNIISYNLYSDENPPGTLDLFEKVNINDIYVKKQSIIYNTLALGADWVHHPTNPVQYAVNQFKQLYLRGKFRLNTGGLQTNPITTLPVSARPTVPLEIMVAARNSDNGSLEFPINVSIMPTGIIGNISYYDTVSDGYYTFSHVIPL